jgi:hypothetical protein
MQGHITDEKGEYVKAAIFRLYKKCGNVEGQEPIDETGVITYAETDEEGRFLIRDLDPEEIYYIEIHIDHSSAESAEEPAVMDEEPAVMDEEPAVMDEEPVVVEKESAAADEEPEYDEDDRIEEIDVVDSLAAKALTGSTSKETLCINCCCNYKADVDLKSKPYLARTNLW